jgi:hypothetical protein
VVITISLAFPSTWTKTGERKSNEATLLGVMNCGDNHLMKFESGTCTWKHLKAANAITGMFQHGLCLL